MLKMADKTALVACHAVALASSSSISVLLIFNYECVNAALNLIKNKLHPQQLGLGLFSIRERIAALGGGMAMESAQGEGTRIELTVLLGR